MRSLLGATANLLKYVPCNRKYWSGTDGADYNTYQPSTLDHIGMSFIFALMSIICGLLYAPLYWLYLASWVYHAIVIELVIDTFVKKKNDESLPKWMGDHFIYVRIINWKAVIAQVIERSIGHILLLPVLITLILKG